MRKLMVLFLIFGLLIAAVVPAFAQDDPDPEATEEAMDEDMMEFEVEEDLGTEDNPIVMLFVPSEDAQEIQAGADEIVALIVEATDLSIEASVATDYAAAIEAMCGAEAHVGGFGNLQLCTRQPAWMR